MQYMKLGSTGLDVSRICLGCMSYGDTTRGGHPWALDEETARPFIKQALELGINFFDTANVYSGGSSEEFLGRAIRDFANRDEVVIATKVHGRCGRSQQRRTVPQGDHDGGRPQPAPAGDRLHRPLPDPSTSTLGLRWRRHWRRCTTWSRPGKVRYLGASSMYAWQFAKALYTADAHGWTRFVSMQDHYNLLNREEEREMLPLCADQGVGVIPWSPLARGRLTRDWDDVTERSETGSWLAALRHRSSDRNIVERVAEVAKERGVPRAQVALAWMLSKPVVTRPSSAPPSRTTSTTRWRPSTLELATRRSPASRSPTNPMPSRDSPDPPCPQCVRHLQHPRTEREGVGGFFP